MTQVIDYQKYSYPTNCVSFVRKIVWTVLIFEFDGPATALIFAASLFDCGVFAVFGCDRLSSLDMADTAEIKSSYFPLCSMTKFNHIIKTGTLTFN